MFNTIKKNFADFMPLRRLVNSLLAIFLGGMMSACADTTTWQEEVKLSDGRVITVTQKRRYEGVYTGQDFGSVVREVSFPLFFVFQGCGLKPPFSAHAES